MMINVTNYNPLCEIIRYYVAAEMQHLGGPPFSRCRRCCRCSDSGGTGYVLRHQPSLLFQSP